MSNGSVSQITRRLGAGLAVLFLAAGAAGCSEGPVERAKRERADDKRAAAPAPSTAAATTMPRPGPAEASGTPAPSQTPPGSTPPAADGPLKGKVVVVDPGHNVHNNEHSAEINRQVDVGNGRKECDTTGTETNSGYTEAEFSLDVSHRLRAILQARGATVTLTHDGDRPWGPCVTERADIGNKAHGDAAVSVHADGAAVGDRGFHVILPASVHAGQADTSAIVGPSKELGARIAGNFVRTTGSAPSNYIGDGTGLNTRDDLGGLNLSTIPKVFIECGNMRDPQDAAQLTDGDWREKAAQGIADGITDFLRR
ncbi:N-acetylmuramoyl-L-alanine amidase [Streptomyces olivoverticillatus]|uniref:N-acetylmuramoyl-L-alanine amidase n=1 Tax=Streptomyces olivoverticillatus TaxID=66427 RepID=A0A7W7PJZ1_9ACTN|nr:N-acetylmuramoyl-L-alanine amidase [Streptomyces olivoverticillatus]